MLNAISVLHENEELQAKRVVETLREAGLQATWLALVPDNPECVADWPALPGLFSPPPTSISSRGQEL